MNQAPAQDNISRTTSRMPPGWVNVFVAIMAMGFAGLAIGAEPAQPSGLRSPYPTVVVPQIVIPEVRPPAINPAPAPVQVPRPPTITSCDPGGCWTSDGTRLNRMGPELTGPRGICNPQAGTANCP